MAGPFSPNQENEEIEFNNHFEILTPVQNNKKTMSMLKSCIQPYSGQLQTETDNIGDYFRDVVITSGDQEKENLKKLKKSFQ